MKVASIDMALNFEKTFYKQFGMNRITTTTPPVRLAWTIWGFGATFYLMGFFQRVAPAVMTTELMLDRNWTGELLQGIRIYDLTAYRAGFLLMLVWALLSLALLFFTRETRCRQIAQTSSFSLVK